MGSCKGTKGLRVKPFGQLYQRVRKPSQTAAWQTKCFRLHWERIGIVEEEKKYHLDIVRVSSVKRRGSGIVDLSDGWKLSM